MNSADFSRKKCLFSAKTLIYNKTAYRAVDV